MRKIVFLASIVFVFLIIASCKDNTSGSISNETRELENTAFGGTRIATNPTETSQTVMNLYNSKIIFEDATVEEYTRSLLKKPYGDITEAEVQRITIFGDSEDGNGSFGDISSPIRTLHDFYHFKNLKKLVLSGCDISNLEGIESLTHLEELRLRRNNISDITPLANLVNLRILDLAENNIKELSALSNLLHLEQLLVEGTNLNLDPLRNLSKLMELYVPFSGVSDITPLKNLTNLTYLQLFHNNVTDISSLNNMSQLKYLEISLNPIKDISVFDVLPELTHISVDIANLSEEQLWDHLYSRHWVYHCTGQPTIYVDVTTVGVFEFSRTYEIQISYSKDISQAFQLLTFDSYDHIESCSEYFVKFSDVNNDGFLDLQLLSQSSAKNMNYVPFLYNKDTRKFVEN